MSPASRRRTFRLIVSVLEPPGRRRVASGLDRWLTRIAPRSARGRVDVAIVPDRIVRALNRRHRGVDSATDVLSFPVAQGPWNAETRPSGKLRLPAGEGDLLGDIVIARGIARRQAREAGHALAMELRILALHGLLHLLGYDHDTDEGRMARVEQRLRRLGGLPPGLLERGR